ncbi:MAG: LLM class flavin-dependent oxidoreductase [Promethearchaeota archaeon]
MDVSDLKIGTEGSFIGDIRKGVQSIKRIEELGYDSIWFADHLMGFTPESIWTPSIIDAANIQPSPHIFYSVISTLTLTAWNTNNLLFGTSVTEPFRRHPAVLAQDFLTLHNLSKGRVILGIGTGEGENNIPYGIEMNRPVQRLKEAIEIIKLLWKNDEKVSYGGKIWTLKDAILAIKPFEENNYPPIWIAAHGPKMLELTAALGDGWIPLYFTPKKYKEKLNNILKIAKEKGRDPEEITPALFCYLVIDEDHDTCDKLINKPVIKNQLFLLPDSIFKEYGTSHPLGENFYGLLHYIPPIYSKEEILNALDKIPDKLIEEYIIHGTSDEIIAKVEEYAKAGLRHVIFYNTTYLADVSKIKSSFTSLRKVLSYFKE